MLKTCNRCKESQPIENFHKNKTTKDGKQNTCKSCKTEMRRLSYDPAVERTRKIKERYGISEEGYDHLFNLQEGACKICRKNFSQLCVDHCHETGKVRGLLCHNCNTMLGLSLDDISTLTNAINYLKST